MEWIERMGNIIKYCIRVISIAVVVDVVGIGCERSAVTAVLMSDNGL